MAPWLLLAALAPSALAAEPSALDRAWYLAESSRIEEALSATVALLHEDPTDTAAHRLHAWLMARALRDAAGAEALYRAWLAEEPGNTPARVALANLLRWDHREPGDWCAEAESLLAQPPVGLDDLYWAQRALYELRGTCPGDQDAPRHAIMKLGEQLPLARAYGLRLQLEEQPVSEELADALALWYAECPWRLSYTGDLWRMGGPAVERAREQALAAAGQAAASDDPLLVDAALRVYRYAEAQEELLAAEERLLELDPGFQRNRFRYDDEAQWVARPGQDPSPTLGLIRAATRGMRLRAALKVARGFEDQLPPSGPDRAAYHAHTATLWEAAGKGSKALEASHLAWRAHPSDPVLANDFAYRAAVSGLMLEEALVAIEGAEANLPGYDPRGEQPGAGYDAWLLHSRRLAAAFADTRGWVLHRLERHPEAASALRRAVLLAPEPNAAHHMHLGLCLVAQEDVDGALRHLGRGLALADGREPELERLAYRRLVELWEPHRWAPGGLEAWIALQAPAEPERNEPADEPSPALGHPLADIAFQQGGQQRRISEIEGVRVVELWATWCGPCRQAMPVLDELAASYAPRGVTFLALSVDAAPEDIESFLDEPFEHLQVGWAGRSAVRAARVRGVPSLFVLDQEGLVRHQHSGWDVGPGGSERARKELSEVIDAVLDRDPPPEKSP